MAKVIDLYGGKRPTELPAYTPLAVAHHLRLPIGTVRYWALGRDHHKPVIELADPKNRLLSFENLVEIHVLSAITRQYGVKLSAVRAAVTYLKAGLHSRRPLLEERMLTDGKSLLVEKYGTYVNASHGGQLGMREVLSIYMERIERDRGKQPVSLSPFTREGATDDPRRVTIDPRIQFGRPCISGTGIPTFEVASRFNAGESYRDLAADFGRDETDIEEAVRYETRLQPAA